MNKKLIIVLAAALTLTACSGEEGQEQQSTQLITLPQEEATSGEPVITEDTLTTDFTEEAITSDQQQTDASQDLPVTEPTEHGSTSSDEGRVTEPTASELPVELEPDDDSPETYSVALDSGNVSKIRYYSAYTGTVSASAYDLTSSVYIKQMTEMLNGLLYTEISASELEADKQEYALWRQENSGEIQPETLIIYDKKGGEIVRFYSDAKSAIPTGSNTIPFSRASVAGKEYKLFYGEPDYSSMQEILLNQQLISRGYFFLEVYLNVAKKEAGERLQLVSGAEPTYRVHSPDETMIGLDGTVLYPESFESGTVLVDCIFPYADGGTLTVTMNAADAEVYQIKSEH